MNPKIPDANALMVKGGLGGAVAYVLLYSLTTWLDILPPIPEGDFMPLVAALSAILGAVFQLIFRERGGATGTGGPSETESGP